MEKTSLRNPYEETPDEPVHDYGAGFARVSAVMFLLLIGIPGLFSITELVREESSSPIADTLEGRLRDWETRFEDADLFERWRAGDQGRLICWFSEGNSRVVIGENGWLFYRPDIDAAVGKGPRYVEPPSVARAPSNRVWKPPLPVVRQFAEQLEERGISLVLVPVPTKAMIESAGFERVSEEGARFRMAPEWDSVREEIESYGVGFVDLVPLFSRLADEGEVFLKQDTHWNPGTMEQAAHLVSSRISEASLPDWEREKKVVVRESQGDLVDMLQLEEAGKRIFEAETIKLTRILDSSTNQPIANDPDSPLVLLGDSFVNIFEDPGLGFGREGEEKIGAGFSSHLADQLGRPLHVIAINGGGATDVRKSFAALPDDEVREKKIVIWVLSARDLFLAEIPGRRAGIVWEPVPFSTRPREQVAGSGPLVLSGTLSARSDAGDPGQTPYASALYSGIFTDIEVESGSYSAGEAWIFLWAFREREFLSPSAHLQTGKRYRLTLAAFPEKGPEASATRIDDFFRADLERLFATGFEELE